jgi:Mn2+/Fe2+ NRAMP family transporter
MLLPSGFRPEESTRMGNLLELFLGVLTALGGSVEVGQLTFSLNGGSKFGYALLWVVVVGTVGIIVYAEMSGRIAAVAKKPVFGLMRERHGLAMGLVALIAATLVNLMTCSAEIGAIAMLIKLAVPTPYRLAVLATLILIAISMWFLSFKAIERVFGLMGLFMLVFVYAAVALKPDWQQMAAGLLPNIPEDISPSERPLYAYYVVAMLSAILLPYEVYFYSSGGIEDQWKPADLNVNRIVSISGFTLGSVLGAALIVTGVEVFRPREMDVDLTGAAALPAILVLGKWGLALAMLGMFAAYAGAAIETAFSSAYNIAQFFGWPWGKFQRPRKAALFALSWIVTLIAAAVLAATGVDPISIVEYSIIFSVVILPLTYLPTLLAARDREIMGRYANGILANVLGAVFLVLITLAAVAAIPLLIVTHGGKA